MTSAVYHHREIPFPILLSKTMVKENDTDDSVASDHVESAIVPLEKRLSLEFS